MARIVQDSDDELDEDLEADLPTSQRPSASSQRLGYHHSPSTGDIDLLGGESQEACSANPQLLPSQDEPQSSVSLPDHPNKRRKTESHLSPGPSPLGISSKREDLFIHGRSAKLNPSSPPIANAPSRLQPGDFAAGDGFANLPEVTWNLEGTMRNDYAQHEPSMFDEPSSTIPNATMTQQRVLEAVNDPVLLGQGSEAEGVCYLPPPEPSVPWSDLMKFTPAGTNEQIESSSREPPPDTLSGTPVSAMQMNLGLPVSQQSKCASSLHPKGSPLRNSSGHIQREIVDSEPITSKTNPQTMPDMSPAAQPEYHGNGQATVKASSRRQHSQQTPSSDDELRVIGLPEERYKPRPSRSRSLKVNTDEPIDYSIRPEKAMKLSKRRRTTAEMRTANAITTPEKVRQICDMGFTPSTTAGALKRNNGDVIQTVDWLVTNNIGHDELAPQSSPRPMQKQRKGDEPPAVNTQAVQDIMRGLNEYRRDDGDIAQSARSAVPDINSTTTETGCTNNTATTLISDLPPEAAQNTSPAKVQVVIPKKSPKTTPAAQAEDTISASSKKAKRRKTTSDQPESEPNQATFSGPEVIADKKRGRGRPKKTTAVAEASKLIEIPEQNAKLEQPSDPPQAIESNSIPEVVGSDFQTAPDKAEPMKPVSSETTAPSNLLSRPSPAEASDTLEKPTKSTTASPMTKSKVPYRVGLSKRARIAPLLRTLKK